MAGLGTLSLYKHNNNNDTHERRYASLKEALPHTTQQDTPVLLYEPQNSECRLQNFSAVRHSVFCIPILDSYFWLLASSIRSRRPFTIAFLA